MRVVATPEEFLSVHVCGKCNRPIEGEAHMQGRFWFALPCGHRLGYQSNSLAPEELALALLVLEGA